MENEHDLQELIANDAGKEGTREEWRTLALQLSHRLNTQWNFTKKVTFWTFAIGFFVGILFLWVTLRFHLYCSFNHIGVWFIPFKAAC